MPTAIVIGATGLVGSRLVTQLIGDSRFTEVVVLARRSCGQSSPKLREHLIDFDRPETWQELVRGDVAFSALGTTLKQAGSKEAQYKVDYTYQHDFARAAARNGVPTFVLCSAAGANEKSRVFYSRMKGELDRDVGALGFRHVTIVRPGLLLGTREKPRFGERLGELVLGAVNAVGIARGYRGIKGETVARAMLNAALDPKGDVRVLQLGEVFRMAGEKV